VGATSARVTVMMRNNEKNPVTIGGFKAKGGSFGVDRPDGCSKVTLAPGGTCPIMVFHAPSGAGDEHGDLFVLADDGRQLTTIPLSGTGTAGIASVDPAQLAAARWDTARSPLPITVTNTGNGLLDLRTLSVTGDFRRRSYGCQGALLRPGNSCEVLVELVPYTSGSYTGRLELTSAGPAATWTFDLRGLIP
jgi:hypothetical protein